MLRFSFLSSLPSHVAYQFEKISEGVKKKKKHASIQISLERTWTTSFPLCLQLSSSPPPSPHLHLLRVVCMHVRSAYTS